MSGRSEPGCGMRRIMNQKHKEREAYSDTTLTAQMDEALAANDG